MRISTSAIYDANVSMLNQQQAKLLHTQQQLASGRRMLTASDDPIASARALEVSQADAMNTQYDTNRKSAISSSTFAEGILQSVTNLLQDVRTSTIDAGGALGSLTNRQSIAVDMQHRLDELQGLANSTDGLGNYLFSGFQGRTLPFTNVAGAFQYNGDDGQRMIQVSSSRQLAGSDSGADIFMRIKSFATQAAAGNTGSGVISLGTVTNPALISGDSYQVSFTGAATYDVTNMTTGAVTPGSYTSGQAITIGGMQFNIKGAPAIGDTFTLTPGNESIFKTISNLIGVLASGTATTAQIGDSITRGVNMLDRGLDSVLTARSSLGARLQEMDALKISGEDLGLSLKAALSELQDVDYNKGISDLNQQQLSLQAAQQSFKKISDLSLFNYI
jgi:flagellar hook-associated protein 3 FlgL